MKKKDSKTIDLLSGLFCDKRRILDGKTMKQIIQMKTGEK